MKEETNNEMDLLLRRLGRRPDMSAFEGNGDVAHLDADELSAYAESVLPAAARARYTEHLAECTRCRELVVQLNSAAGVVPVVETTKVPAPSALRNFLASLFSPMVLQYAVPALGLILVAAIGVFVLRQRQQSPNQPIAQNAEAPGAKPYVAQNSPEPGIATHGYSDAPSKEPVAGKHAPRSSGSPENQVAAAAPAAPPAQAAVNQPARDALAKKEDQPPIEIQNSTIGPPKPGAADTPAQQAKTEPREEASPAEKAKDVAADSVRVEDRKAEIETEKTAEGKNKAPTTTLSIASLRAGVVGGNERQRDDDTVSSDKESKAETRTVAGRRFRKQDGGWVDTAYNSARSVVNVTRGSEQYRALIADEPELKKIAEQLKGEIVVVWKGHTYRIH
jgi:hypothetical protein